MLGDVSFIYRKYLYEFSNCINFSFFCEIKLYLKKMKEKETEFSGSSHFMKKYKDFGKLNCSEVDKNYLKSPEISPRIPELRHLTFKEGDGSQSFVTCTEIVRALQKAGPAL